MHHVSLGRRGEDDAVRFLEGRGWRILGRNVREGRKEVDVIAMKGRVLAFVEVKCRTGSLFGHPAEAITWKKRREIASVARAWLRGRSLPEDTLVRFDAISILRPPGGDLSVEHVPDAWRLD